VVNSVQPDTSAAVVVIFACGCVWIQREMWPALMVVFPSTSTAGGMNFMCSQIHGEGCDFGGVLSGGGVSRNSDVGIGINRGGLGSGVAHPVKDIATNA
jgi:hypothetical protein